MPKLKSKNAGNESKVSKDGGLGSKDCLGVPTMLGGAKKKKKDKDKLGTAT